MNRKSRSALRIKSRISLRLSVVAGKGSNILRIKYKRSFRLSVRGIADTVQDEEKHEIIRNSREKYVEK